MPQPRSAPRVAGDVNYTGTYTHSDLMKGAKDGAPRVRGIAAHFARMLHVVPDAGVLHG